MNWLKLFTGKGKALYNETSHFNNANLNRMAIERFQAPPTVSVYGWGGFPFGDTYGGPSPGVLLSGQGVISNLDYRGNAGGSPVPTTPGLQPLFNPDYSSGAGSNGSLGL